ncbi:3-dehydroquinate synthase [Alicyclobacillus herbarius]|uniref:3-dehydroquinate synthase n=1 Tax=Alicyclobacillus herbarius TaxID=122960 RepID=UPI0004035EEF|nr:3-dehydroquinate synthase [Alicyclobacillus herbarius]
MTTRIDVHTSSRTYPFVIGPGLRHDVGEELRRLGLSPNRALFLVGDETIRTMGILRDVEDACRGAGYPVATAVVPPGDASKSWTNAYQLYQQMLSAQIRRDGVVVAVGGGMVGDLAGFVAATYLRGVLFVQVPTTLLAHDSSIGGKVGVNLPEGKNLVGAFHQPAAVLFDTECLATLPEGQWRSGMAEVIKHGIIGNPELFARLEASPVPSYPGAKAAEQLVAEAARVKIGIVEADEQESGLRMVLNLGHTVGHAVEQVSEYELSHGEAVAIGMAVEADLAVARGLLSETERDRMITVLRQHGLPTEVPDYPLDTILAVLARDKKNRYDGWTFALPAGIGRVEIVRGIGREELATAWRARLRTT